MDTAEPLRNVTLAVIAGGMGTRMGKPKAWLRVGERSILAWMLDRLQWPGPTMLVTAPAVPSPPDRERFDLVVADPVDGVGPLRGILTSLEHASTPAVVAVAVDMPLVDRPQLEWLVGELLRDTGRLGVMTKVSIDGEAHIEPFPAAYRTEASAVVSQELAVGNRSVHRLCGNDRFISLPAPADWRGEVWTNLNDPIQFAAFERSMQLTSGASR